MHEALDEIEREVERRFGPLPPPEPDEQWRYEREAERVEKQDEQPGERPPGGDEGHGTSSSSE